MAATVLGQNLTVGATSTVGTWTDYYLESVTQGDKQVDFEDVFDEDGKRASRVVYSKLPKLEVTAIVKDGIDPAAVFIPGTLISGTTFMVTSAPVTVSKSPWRVTVSAVDYGLAAVV